MSNILHSNITDFLAVQWTNTSNGSCSQPFMVNLTNLPLFIIFVLYMVPLVIISFVGIKYYYVSSFLLLFMVHSSTPVYMAMTLLKIAFLYKIIFIILYALLFSLLLAFSKAISKAYIGFTYGTIIGIIIMSFVRYFTFKCTGYISMIVILICGLLFSPYGLLLDIKYFGLPTSGVASFMLILLLDYCFCRLAISTFITSILLNIKVDSSPCWQHWLLALSTWIILTCAGTISQYFLISRKIYISEYSTLKIHDS